MTQIPGVTIDRRFGQGERVSIDGTDPSLNLTFLDGHPVAQSIWLFGEQPNRGFDQTQIASEIIGRIEVYKSPEARLPEGSLGGTVLMHTRRPLDLEANTLTGTFGYNYNEQAERGEAEHLRRCTAGRTPPKRGASRSPRSTTRNRSIARARRSSAMCRRPPSRTSTGVDPNAQVPNFVNAAWFQQTRERDSVTANLQFKPSEALEFNLSGLVHQGRFRQLQPVDVQLPLAAPRRGRPADCRRRTASSLADMPGPNSVVFYDNNVRGSEPTTKGLDLQGA